MATTPHLVVALPFGRAFFLGAGTIPAHLGSQDGGDFFLQGRTTRDRRSFQGMMALRYLVRHNRFNRGCSEGELRAYPALAADRMDRFAHEPAPRLLRHSYPGAMVRHIAPDFKTGKLT
jgi:hypothetical protein